MLAGLVGVASGSEPRDTPVPGDDATYRTTVVVRKGAALGTGTIIASVEGETLILTAAHVVEEPGESRIELNRYNLGLERTRSTVGFPRRLDATIAALDGDTDLAILRVRGQLALPYIARIVSDQEWLTAGTPVTSIGFDHGERLIGFPTRLKRIDRVDLDRGGGDRSFLITEHPPEMGRSGGGLFLEDGRLVGVCLARAQLKPGRVLGMYSTVGNVWRLIRGDDALATLVARSKPVIRLVRPTPGSPRNFDQPRINRTGDRVRAN